MNPQHQVVSIEIEKKKEYVEEINIKIGTVNNSGRKKKC
jgi:hypothetical protein